jgi:hypothetical protein
MKKFIKISLIVLGVLLVLFVGLIILAGNSPDPSKAPELAGEELDSFLNSTFRYWNGWGGDKLNGTETIAAVFYSGKQADGYTIGAPKSLGKKGEGTSVVIPIQENDKPVDSANTMVYIIKGKDGKSSLDRVEQLKDGHTTRLGQNLGEMNTAFIQIFPDSFFSEYAAKWEALSQADYREMVARREKEAEERELKEKQQAEERAAHLTPEGWPKDSIYNSLLLIRAGVLDFHDYTVGNVFYTGKRAEGVKVEKPRSKSGLQVIDITLPNGKCSVFLRYDSKNQMSLIEKIEVKATGEKTQVATSFEEKYAILLMILPMLINEGNVGG